MGRGSRGPAVLSIVRAGSWDAARDLARRLPRSAFRGQPDQRQVPTTTPEREKVDRR